MYDILLLTAQAVKSGVPLSTAIRLSVGDQPSRRHAALLRFANLLDKGIEPKVAAARSGLPRPTVALLDTALTSGDFAGTFDALAKLELSRTLTIQRVLQALAYPLILLVSSVFLLGIILIVTVPGFEEIFNDFDMDMPVMTQQLLQLSHMASSPLTLLGLGVFALTLYICTKLWFPRFWFCVPVIGHIGRSLYTARVLRQLANQVSRNVPLPEALDECSKTMRNSAYRSDCRSAAHAARRGMSLAEIAIRYYWLFPAWLSPMIAVDDAREVLAKSLRRSADAVEQQQDVSILLVQAMALPLFLMIMFCAVGFLVTALFMPQVMLITALSA
ncbi:MAG: type II secretion system F family protein [Planctomycetaceae bacterium]|nr:type II secretion system F family protein [Planctomycetaceae bacterium]